MLRIGGEKIPIIYIITSIESDCGNHIIFSIRILKNSIPKLKNVSLYMLNGGEINVNPLSPAICYGRPIVSGSNNHHICSSLRL